MIHPNGRLWPKPDTIWSNQDARMVKKLKFFNADKFMEGTTGKSKFKNPFSVLWGFPFLLEFFPVLGARIPSPEIAPILTCLSTEGLPLI